MSKISIQINQLLVDSQKYLLQKIATEYKLDYQELLSKFLEEGKQSEHTVLAPDPALPDVRIVAKKPAVKKTKVPDNKKKSTRPHLASCCSHLSFTLVRLYESSLP